jgi:hypothetical protein
VVCLSVVYQCFISCNLPINIKKNSEDIDQMYPGYTSCINNARKIYVKSSIIYEYAHTFKTIQMKNNSLWNFSCTNFHLSDTL